jgi:hypothetical protein
MDILEELPSWIVVLSGLAIVAAGLVWRYLRRDHSEERDPNMPDLPGPTGGDRTSHVLILVGGAWTIMGVAQWLG